MISWNIIDGDINEDKFIDQYDYNEFQLIFCSTISDYGLFNPNADLNYDGVINFLDLRIFRQYYQD